jgi:REase_AHJR-like
MNFEKELERVAGLYTSQGYQVVVRPGPEDLPPFARDFKVEIVARRVATGVLVTVKKDRIQFAADPNVPRYAEVTGAQPGWRFDFAIVGAEDPALREFPDARELSDEDIDKGLVDAEQLIGTGYVRPAVITAWAGLEAAMRRRLRAMGEKAGPGTTPLSLVGELYANGSFFPEELENLERIYLLRNEIVHGFAAPTVDAGDVRFLVDTGRRLLEESQPAKQSA